MERKKSSILFLLLIILLLLQIYDKAVSQPDQNTFILILLNNPSNILIKENVKKDILLTPFKFTIVLTSKLINNTKIPLISVTIDKYNQHYIEILACNKTFLPYKLELYTKEISKQFEKNEVSIDLSLIKNMNFTKCLKITIISNTTISEKYDNIIKEIANDNFRTIHIVKGIKEKIVDKRTYQKLLEELEKFLHENIRKKIILLPINTDKEKWVNSIISKLKENYSPFYTNLFYSQKSKEWIASHISILFSEKKAFHISTNEKNREPSPMKRKDHFLFIDFMLPLVISIILSYIAYYITKNKIIAEK